MNKRGIRTVSAILIFSSLAVSTPAFASGGLCDPDNTTYSAWFARTFGYCKYA